MDRAPVEIALKDTSGRYVMVSRRFEELQGIASDEAVGRTAYNVFPEETARVIEAHDVEVLGSGEVSEREISVPLDDGVHTYLTVKFPVLDAEGRVAGIGAISSDITERKRAQEALREARDDLEAQIATRTGELVETNRALRAREAELKQVHQITRLGHWSWHPETDRLSLSPEAMAILGASDVDAGELTREDYLNRFVHPDDRARVAEVTELPEHAGARFDVAYRVKTPDGSERWVNEVGEAVVDETGKAIGEVGTIQDISDRRYDETALRESEERFRGIFEQGSVGVAVMSPEGRFLQVNPAYSNFIGYRAGELVGQHFGTVIHPDDLSRVTAHWDAVMAGGAIAPVDERRYRHKSGDVIWGLAGLTLLRDPDGGVTSYMVQVQDITERKRAERALQDSEQRLRDFAEATSDWFWEMDAELRFTYVSYRATADAGRAAQDVIGKTRWEFAGADPEDGEWRRHIADLSARVPFRDFRYERAGGDDGKRQYFSISGKPLFDDQGEFKGYRGTGTDITAEVEAQSRTEEVRARFFDAIENSTEAIALFDKDDKLVLYNSRYGEIVGRVVPGLLRPGIPLERIVREGARKGLYGVAEEEIERVVAQRLEDHRNLPMVRQHRLGDGSWVQVREQRTGDGGMILVQTDITELRESEARLRQAQKMEAVGQLTGGVAHDFNNLLGVIMGNAEILADRVGESDPQLGAILRATRRGAELTDRLLAFSRRQALAPKSVDLDELILGMTDLLARTLGETILITATKTPELWRAAADPGQLENALINLAINARDAMPAGGKLVIETANMPLRDMTLAERHGVSTGDYVSLLVTDSGHGMPPDVLARAADPFFTTKGVGQGSGLGLSMVEGFARQSGGFLTIESSPDAGTMVKVVLPRAEEGPEPATSGRKAQEPKARGETILVVEDDPDLRGLAVSILNHLGYRVVEAEDGRAALEILRKQEPIDLILTDVVLPGGLSGPELVTKCRGWQPGVRVLFMSGYATDLLGDRDRPDAAGELLNKPFHRAELAERVRSALDQPETSN
jgi:PAS domain S-box-containing protein